MSSVPLNTCHDMSCHVLSRDSNTCHGKFWHVLALSVLLHGAALLAIPGLTNSAPQALPALKISFRAAPEIQTESETRAAPEQTVSTVTPYAKSNTPAKKSVIAQKTGTQKPTYKALSQSAEGESTGDPVKTAPGAIAQVLPVEAPKNRAVRVNANTPDIRYSFYLEAWQQKVERVGRMMYPGNESGSLRLLVSVNADGSLKGCAVLNSSHNERLDSQACRIVEAAAPYAPLPPDLKREADVLEIVRAWRFDTNT